MSGHLGVVPRKRWFPDSIITDLSLGLCWFMMNIHELFGMSRYDQFPSKGSQQGGGWAPTSCSFIFTLFWRKKLPILTTMCLFRRVVQGAPEVFDIYLGRRDEVIAWKNDEACLNLFRPNCSTNKLLQTNCYSQTVTDKLLQINHVYLICFKQTITNKGNLLQANCFKQATFELFLTNYHKLTDPNSKTPQMSPC